ncbi:hypothetical protein TRVL_10142 [Trypanosoma vivax]|nr:hypothetical protein TRVL_10142 [Trypanosoma vivax]
MWPSAVQHVMRHSCLKHAETNPGLQKATFVMCKHQMLERMLALASSAWPSRQTSKPTPARPGCSAMVTAGGPRHANNRIDKITGNARRVWLPCQRRAWPCYSEHGRGSIHGCGVLSCTNHSVQ